MKHRDLTNYSERAIVDMDNSTGPEYTPNMQNGSIFRIVDTVDITMVNPKNLKDGQYIRFELQTEITNTITFGTQYTIDGTAISVVTNTNGLYILEGRYSHYLAKMLLRVV